MSAGQGSAAIASVGTQSTGLQAAWSRTLTWVSLFSAAIGFLSFFDELMPNLVRLSFVFKALTGAYTFVRDWVWSGAQWLFGLIQITLPTLSEAFLDALAIAALAIAALNFESILRYRRAMFLDLVRDLWAHCARTFGVKNRHTETLFVGTYARNLIGGLAGFFVLGLCLRALLAARGIELPTLRIEGIDVGLMSTVQSLLEAAVLGVAICALSFGLYQLAGDLDDPPSSVSDGVCRATMQLLLLLPNVAAFTFNALLNGWRSIMLAVGLVVVLAGANWAAMRVLDPIIRQPPQWLCAMVRANPDALPEPRCGG